MQLQKISVLVLAMSSASVQVVAAASVKSAFDLPQTYSATAFGQAGAAAGKSFGLTVYITGWTSDQEVHQFATILKNKGPNGLVSSLEKTKDVGRLSRTGSVGFGLRIARIRQIPDAGFRTILATNRPISFPELYHATRSRDYQFGIVVLNVDKNGNGTGSFAPACKVKFNKKGELEIEHYGQKPLRLADVRLEK
jgi:hypothetical protein